MLRFCLRSLGVLAIVACSLFAFQAPSRAGQNGAFIRVGLPTLTPFGWADFCLRYEDECQGGALAPVDLAATPANMKLVDRINRLVNHTIAPISDMDHWQVVDRWDYPADGAGDCEDYVLYKRRLLIQAGLPRQALLVTIVRDEAGDGHAVLTVKTTQGEFILDNMTEDMLPFAQTPYRFIKRQSQEDPNIWVGIGATPAGPQMVSR